MAGEDTPTSAAVSGMTGPSEPLPTAAPAAPAGPVTASPTPTAGTPGTPPPQGGGAPPQDPNTPQYTGVGKLYHSVLDVLSGGGSNTRVEFDPNTGQRKVITDKEDPSLRKKPGQQWAQILAGALTGLAAGSEVHGPGAAYRSFAVGAEAASEKQLTKNKRQEDLGEKEAESVRQTKLANASLAISHQALIKSIHENNAASKSFIDSNAQNRQFIQDSIDKEGGSLVKGPGPDGMFSKASDLNELAKSPEVQSVMKAHTGGNLVIRPVTSEEMGADGAPTGRLKSGYMAVVMPIGWGDQRNKAAVDIYKLNPKFDSSKPGGADNEMFEKTTVLPNGIANKDIETNAEWKLTTEHAHQSELAKVEAEKQQAAESKAKASEAPSNIAKNQAEANRQNAEALLAKGQAAQMANMGVTTPPGFVPDPARATKPQADIEADLRSKGVAIPADFASLYQAAHYKGDPTILFPKQPRVKGGGGVRTMSSANNFILNFINDKYNPEMYKVIDVNRKEAASTKPNTIGGNLVNFDTATGHLGALYSAGKYLQMGPASLPFLNKIAQAYGYQMGKSPTVVYNTIKNGLTGEIGKTFGSTTIPELANLADTLKAYNSPEDLTNAAKTYAHMMLTKAGEVDNHVHQSTEGNWDLPPDQVVSPNARKVFKMMGIDPDVELGKKPAGAAAPQQQPQAGGGMQPSAKDAGPTPPPGAKFKVKGSDQQLHWSDSDKPGGKDLGLVQ